MTPVLSVRNLKVHFPLSSGLLGGPPLLVKAVDDVSFDLAPARCWAWSANPAAASPPWAAPCCS